MNIETIKGGKGTVALRKEGIIHLAWQPGVNLTDADVRAAMDKVDEVASGKPRPLLVEMTDTTVSSLGRAAFSWPSAASRIALLGSSPVDAVVASFRHPDSFPCPTRFFTSVEQALEWLGFVSNR